MARIFLRTDYLGTIKRQTRKALVISLSVFGIAACSNDMSDLKEFVKSEKEAKRTTVSPPPEVVPHETFRYQANALRSPFAQILFGHSKAAQTKQRTAKGNGLRPDDNRHKEVLETYPLDSLSMVGTLQQNAGTWALIKGGDGTIHRVHAGNYLGQNHGKVIRVTESKVELLEIVPDGLGDWMERPASLALKD